jgi:hypothetical protein
MQIKVLLLAVLISIVQACSHEKDSFATYTENEQTTRSRKSRTVKRQIYMLTHKSKGGKYIPIQDCYKCFLYRSWR